MKTFKLILIVLTFLSTSLYSQPPAPRFTNRGDSLYYEGNIPGAIAEYRKILSSDPQNARAAYNLACAYSIDNSMIRKFDSCFKYLNKAVALDTSINALTDPDLLSARSDPEWKKFEERLIKLYNIKTGNAIKNTGYASALWRLMASDQAYFSEIGVAVRKLEMRSSVTSALWRAKLINSENNARELAQLIDANGWPRTSEVGREASMAAYLIVQHSNAAMQKKYLPAVKKVCEAGELPWERYALMYDRMCFNDKVPQLYGTHTVFNEQTRENELYPVADISGVDIRRKEMGMEPLDVYLKRNKIRFTPGQK